MVVISPATAQLIVILRDKLHLSYDQIVLRLANDFDIHTNAGLCAHRYAQLKKRRR
jgi:hypothetical protein